MALDPNIALAVRVAPFETRIQSPVDRYARMLSLRQLMQQQETSQALEEERRQKAQLAREEAEREARFRGRFKVGQPMPTTTEAYGELGITGGAKYAEDLRKTATEQQATEKARLENEKLRDTHLGQIAGGVLKGNTQESFERGIMDAGARDLISQEELHQLMGLRWDDPQTKAQVAQIARRGSEVEAQQRMDIAAAQEGRAEKLGAPALAKTTAESLGTQLKVAAQSAPDNQTDWDTWRAGLSTDLQQMIPAMYSPTNRQRVLQSGLTPAERGTGERAAATATETARHHRSVEERTAAAAAETARHNRAIEARISQANAGGLTPPQRQAVLQIGGQFDNEPMVKNYNVIAESGNFVRNLAEGFGGNAGDDQALLYAFAKAMDPGSVVREGEYATVQKYSQSWADTFGFKAARIFSNSPFLSDDARQKMKATIEKKVVSAKTSYENIYNEYGRRIEETAGVENGKRFITNYGQAFSGAAPEKNAGGAAPGAPAVGTVKGGYKFTGGDPADKKNWRKVT